MTIHLKRPPLEHQTRGGDKILGIKASYREGRGYRVDGVHLPWEELSPEGGILEVAYRYAGASADHPLLLKVTGGEGEAAFDFFPRTGGGKLTFHLRGLGFIPRTISLDSPHWQAEGLTYSPEVPLAGGNLSPLTADTGTILHFPQESWRNGDYELFRWNLFPEVLYLSTGNYRIQSRFFKRLAFFTEKPGYAGTLVSNEVLKNQHGWNAHDYSAQGLAGFFNLADQKAFPLNPEEELLREIAINAGLILSDGEGYRPGRGAIVGTSLETFYEQRLIFTIHESIHGLFFIHREFQEVCEDFWASLSPEEQDFWRNFLAFRRYNVKEDHRLLVTEVSAHLLQQPPDEADDYFIGFITPRLLRKRPHLAAWLIPYLEENPTVFSEAGIRLGEELRKLYGMDVRSFHELLPQGRSRRKIFEGLKAGWLARFEKSVQGID